MNTPPSDPFYIDWIDTQKSLQPDAIAFIDLYGGREFSWQQLDARVTRLANGLTQCGVKFGDRVAYVGLNTTDIIDMLYACMRIRAIYVPLNFRLTAQELSYIIGDASPTVLFFDTDFTAVVEVVAENVAIPHVIATQGNGHDSAYELLIQHSPETPVAQPPANGDTQTMIMYSSGTTGHPKGVIYTQRMLVASALNIQQSSLLTTDSTLLNVMPMFHIGGLQFVLMSVYSGITTIMMRAFDPGAVLDCINDVNLGVTNLGGVPAMWAAMSAHPACETTDFSRIRTAGTGAESVPRPMLEEWMSRGITLQEVYGMTETAGVICMAQISDLPQYLGWAGKALPYCQFKVMASDTQEATRGEVGEVWMHGATVTPGYWQQPEATKEAICDGWLKSGDIGRMDVDGRLSIEDRSKDMYISGGENVYPAEVESVLMRHPAIAEVAVIGVAHERWGEVGCAIAATHPEQTVSHHELIALCEDTLAKYKWPTTLQIIDALPRNSTGKVQKFLLRQQFAKVSK